MLSFQPPIIAHRGASAYAPENTMSAFFKAAQLGIHWIEFDVMQAACGEPVIFHDDELIRITTHLGEIKQYPYSYLQSLDAGSWFDPKFANEKIPNLTAVLEMLSTTGLKANIEIKAATENEEELVQKVVELVGTYFGDQPNRILFSSFSFSALHFLRRYLPKGQLGLLLDQWENNWEEIYNDLGCISLHLNHAILTAKLAHQIKKENKLLLCYTINDPERAAELYSWGVDALFSDAPDLLLNL